MIRRTLFSLERIRHSLRVLARSKRFSALAILSLGLAIALNTTMYSVLDAMINPRIAMRAPEQLFTLQYFGDYHGRIAAQVKREGLRGLHALSDLATLTRLGTRGTTLVERGSRDRDANVALVSGNYFAMLGNQPSAGRLLSRADSVSGATAVVLSERMWNELFPDQRWFAGATVVIEGEPREVIGLLPYEADFPGANTDAWGLLQSTRAPGLSYNLVRVRDGVSPDEARTELTALAARWTAEVHDDYAGWFRFRPAKGEPFRFQRFHLAMIGAVVAVLLVACVNLANLQLARGISRSRELATRAAIGASRTDIIGQLMLETAWLALGGLIVGGLLTAWGMALVGASVPRELSDYLVRPQVSWRVATFAAVVSLGALVLVGLVPAVRLSRVNINDLLKSGAGTGTSRRTRRQYGALVVVQVGLALALCVAATLLLRVAATLERMKVNPKYDRIVSGWVFVKPSGPADHRRVADVAAELVARARAVPTVADAAVFTQGQPRNRMITLDDDGGVPREIGVGMFSYDNVSSSYLRTMGLDIVKGRDFTEGEFAERLVIVDQQTAAYLWPGANPIGRLVKLGNAASDLPWLRVIGVVRYENYWASYDRANEEARLAPRLGTVLVLNGADTTRLAARGLGMRIFVRGTTRPERLPGMLTRALSDVSLGTRPVNLGSVTQSLRLDELRAKQNFVSALFATFALLALAVAALGVYAIVSHTVSQRTREFGLRMALGADERDIRVAVLQEGNVLALSGIALGLILAARSAGLLQAFLRTEYDRYDSWLYAIAALTLFAATFVASWLPARRAMRTNPVEALRND